MSANPAASSASHTAGNQQQQGQYHPAFNCNNCYFNFPYTYLDDPFKFPDLGTVRKGYTPTIGGEPLCHNCLLAWEESRPRAFEEESNRRRYLLGQVSTNRAFTPKTSRAVVEQWENFDRDWSSWKTAWNDLRKSKGTMTMQQAAAAGPARFRPLASKPMDFKGKAVDTMETVPEEDENAVPQGSVLTNAAWNRMFREEELVILEWPVLNDEALDGMVWNFEGETSASGKGNAQ